MFSEAVFSENYEGRFLFFKRRIEIGQVIFTSRMSKLRCFFLTCTDQSTFSIFMGTNLNKTSVFRAKFI